MKKNALKYKASEPMLSEKFNIIENLAKFVQKHTSDEKQANELLKIMSSHAIKLQETATC